MWKSTATFVVIFFSLILSFLVPHFHGRLSFSIAQETHHFSSPFLTSVTSFSLTTLHMHRTCVPKRLFSKPLAVSLRRVKCLLLVLFFLWSSAKRTRVIPSLPILQRLEHFKCYFCSYWSCYRCTTILYVLIIPQLDFKILRNRGWLLFIIVAPLPLPSYFLT